MFAKSGKYQVAEQQMFVLGIYNKTSTQARQGDVEGEGSCDAAYLILALYKPLIIS
jgi:hypothetical protein